MAVKIIKEGNKKEVFEGWCMYCGCEFEYEKEDTSDNSYDQREKCNYYSGISNLICNFFIIFTGSTQVFIIPDVIV